LVMRNVNAPNLGVDPGDSRSGWGVRQGEFLIQDVNIRSGHGNRTKGDEGEGRDDQVIFLHGIFSV